MIETITCADGQILQLTRHEPPQGITPKAVVQINPATAVAERMYHAFAATLASQGFRVITYNYRGVGLSGSETKHIDAGFTTWADYDVEAVTQWVSDTSPDIPHFAIGHSFGGHAIGLCSSSRLLHAAVMISSHAGCLHFIRPAGERLRVAFILKVIGPLSSLLCGYFPGRRFRVGENMPGRVMREWSHWTSLPQYFFDDPALVAEHRFARPRFPVLSLGFTDDPWAPAEAIALVANKLANCSVELRQYGPEHSHGQSIGHMGFFREKHASTLWPDITDWLLKQVNDNNGYT